MAQFHFKTAGGDLTIPVADDDFFTGPMQEFSKGNCFLEFLDGSGDPVTPTGGTIVFKSAAIDGQFLDAPVIQSINAVDVEVGDASYTPPSFNSVVVDTRMTLAGITGAVSVRAFHWRSF